MQEAFDRSESKDCELRVPRIFSYISRRTIRIWLLDFNLCHVWQEDTAINHPEAFIDQLVEALFEKDPYYPLPLIDGRQIQERQARDSQATCEDHRKKLRDQAQRSFQRIESLGTGDPENLEDDQDEISISTSDSESRARVQFIGPSPGVPVQPYQDTLH